MEVHKIHLTDVTGRDGFQMEKDWIETEDKIKVLNRIIEAGVNRIEATSFVSPKAIPQLRDAKEVLANLNRSTASIVVLVPNMKGAEYALAADVDEVNVVVSVSETHNRKNINKSVDDSIRDIKEIFSKLNPQGKLVNVGLATTFGCPFEGIYEVNRVEEVIHKLHSFGIDRFMLADTTGLSNPVQISTFTNYLRKKFPDVHFSLHLHNTRGMGLVNLYAAYQAGIRHFDAALGGIGGCPFAPGATGNICLEDTVHMLDSMGISSGIDVRKLIDASKELEKILGYKLPGQVLNAGLSEDTVQA